ncbi:MAG: hypothetical protein H7647_06270, partial [Candidatus Heimdallarchaeota archaeon]|nr:hypothetical protein [Candidatus Heimdallarchaeota archaeon]MCK4254031.1 hypothetical protein [Candidatus Heimdallarchaeota archaeon]
MGRNINKKILTCTIIALFTFSIISPILLENNLNNFFIDPFSNIVNDNNISPNTSDLTNRIKFDYTPIDSFSDSGDSSIIDDTLAVCDSINITLDADNNYNDSYTITAPSGYSGDNLQYNLSLESAVDKEAYFLLEPNKLVEEALESTRIRYAFKFDVSTSYATFKGAQMWFDLYGGSYGSDELELFLVEEDGLGFPNMSAILANDTSDLYSTSNPFPTSSPGDITYFEFSTNVLSSGSYFVVANLSSYDGDDGTGISWGSRQTLSYRVYYHDGSSWNSDNPHARTLNFEAYLQETDSDGNPLTYPDPTTVYLTDNGL